MIKYYLTMLEWGPTGTYRGTVLVIVLGVDGVLVDMYEVWDVDVVWKCLINGNGTMIIY